MYLNLTFCAYGHFLTFSLVMDSCYTEEDDKGNTTLHWVQKIGRIFFHSMFVCLISFSYFAASCDEHMYPPIFLAVGIFILSQQIFDLVFHYFDYLIDWDNLPPLHLDKLRYNKELFMKQMRVLLLANILFGSFSVITIVMGFKFVNKN